ncbi:putative aldouronate transport system permease protein [Paenibacillus sp. UNCCL117]|uniref:ABC transporter permease n=1 Tax=unclassified Paenibacillus TaxID=185978 RepID=UPI0008835D06|nr:MULTISPECIES: ABC transporter permease subunit [unclassified Paenibacillus]SDC43080.1 putative aldouronate transport system permease protein [Paenibacillus sp. cl123]SFW13040.1 putative aldouronate transport system permease protein [Paenibacillus sp. UNCCL117]
MKSATASPSSLKASRRREAAFGGGLLKELNRNKYLYALSLPAILYFVLFAYLPMFGMVIAFQDYNPIKGIFGSEFVGLKNFDFFFTSNDWLIVTMNTLYLNALFIGVGLAVQVVFAIMISEIGFKPFKRVTQSLMLLPYFISWPIVSMFAVSLFATEGGLINKLLVSISLDPIAFYQNPDVWPATLVLLKVWKATGYGVIIYLATITSIDTEIYEAARIDGASRLQAIRHITVPLLGNTTILLLLLAVGHIFYGDFGMIYALIGDNALLYPTTDVIDTFVFRALRQYSDMSMSSAIGMYQSIVGFLLVLGCNTVVRKLNKDAALF